MGVAGANAGSKHYAWKGGRRVMHGRVLLYAPEHPRAHARHRCVYEHILVAEAALGHLLPAGAVVHHVDENPMHNANRNLAILQSRGEHMSLHARLRVLRAGGNPWTQRICGSCGEIKDNGEFPTRSKPVNGSLRTPWCLRCCRAANVRSEERRRQQGVA